MKTKLPYLVLSFLIFFSGRSSSLLGGEQGTKRPNIVLIMADDMGYECLSSNGALSYQTPFLDRLGSTSIHFTQGHAQPLCTPSRVKIMTGKYNYRNYKSFGYLDINEPTFGNMLKDAGYATCVVGKWQLNGYDKSQPDALYLKRPQHFGFDEYCLWNFLEPGNRYADPVLYQNGKKLDGLEDSYGPDLVCDYAIDFIERNKDKSFFLYYPMILVHSPFVPTPDSEEWMEKDRRHEKNKRYFVDMVAYTDKIVGKLHHNLLKLGLLDNTIFIFTADNGTHFSLITQTLNGPYPGGKGTMRNAGTHVPLIASWPTGGHKEVHYDDLIEFSDFLPTFADAAGIRTPEGTDGVSFYPLLNGQKQKPRETIFVHYDPLKKGGNERWYGRFVRNMDFKLYSDGRFYQVIEDPWEKNRLPENQLTIAQKILRKTFQLELDSAPAHHFQQSKEYR